jgi:hypothetical protein
MGNSTKTLQNIVDSVTSIGDLALNLPVGGWGNEPSLTIANDVMTELLSKKFPWKWNRKVVAPFYTNTLQHDYAQVSLTDIGWIENASLIDINSTSLPKRLEWLEAVRDLARSSQSAGRPMKICWLPNDQLVQGVWPGAGKVYTNPVGAIALPDNPTTNILDANGNILVLTTYGITGGVAPLAIASRGRGNSGGGWNVRVDSGEPEGRGLPPAALAERRHGVAGERGGADEAARHHRAQSEDRPCAGRPRKVFPRRVQSEGAPVLNGARGPRPLSQ